MLDHWFHEMARASTAVVFGCAKGETKTGSLLLRGEENRSTWVVPKVVERVGRTARMGVPILYRGLLAWIGRLRSHSLPPQCGGFLRRLRVFRPSTGGRRLWLVCTGCGNPVSLLLLRHKSCPSQFGWTETGGQGLLKLSKWPLSRGYLCFVFSDEDQVP